MSHHGDVILVCGGSRAKPVVPVVRLQHACASQRVHDLREEAVCLECTKDMA